MDRFGPTEKVSKKRGPPFELDHFSLSDWLELWLNGSRSFGFQVTSKEIRTPNRKDF